MPGAYAHITAARLAAENIDAVPGLPQEAKPLILENLEFVQLGALGPDFPYLDLYHRDNKAWADAMHYNSVDKRILTGIGVAAGMQGDDRDRALAWLLGFTAHVITDVTIHPIVEAKVGRYEGHELEHRICEMHQDVYIFTTRSGLDFQRAEFLKRMTRLCSDPKQDSHLHPSVASLWEQMLKRTDGALYKKVEPHIDAWFYWFSAVAGGIVDDHFIGLGRHVFPWLDGYAYPLPGDVDRAEYIDALKLPDGLPGTMSYDQVFSQAVANVRQSWAAVASDVLTGGSLAVALLQDWDLDTGMDKRAKARTYWPTQAAAKTST